MSQKLIISALDYLYYYNDLNDENDYYFIFLKES